MTLSTTSSEYGEVVMATARVSSSTGAPQGAVAFSVDGLATQAGLDAAGVASLTLLPARTGSHHVTATFVPADATQSTGSTSPAQTWTVVRARTTMGVPISGKRRGRATRVGVEVDGAFDTVPTGKVRIRVTRIGKPGAWVKGSRLDSGRAAVTFGRLTVGRYRVVVDYLGDADHLTRHKVKKIRVRP